MIYYWETHNNFGQFAAKSDKKALKKMPKNCIVLYKENDTEDGRPFIVVYENEPKTKIA